MIRQGSHFNHMKRKFYISLHLHPAVTIRNPGLYSTLNLITGLSAMIKRDGFPPLIPCKEKRSYQLVLLCKTLNWQQIITAMCAVIMCSHAPIRMNIYWR